MLITKSYFSKLRVEGLFLNYNRMRSHSYTHNCYVLLIAYMHEHVYVYNMRAMVETSVL